MLETSVEYCPPSHVPFDAETTEILLHASYDGVPCALAMECYVRYTLVWETGAAPTTPSGGGKHGGAGAAAECVAPPTATPTLAPSTPSPSSAHDDGTTTAPPVTTPPPAGLPEGVSSSGGGSNNSDSSSGDKGEVVAFPPPRENYLSRSVVRCAEVWANCTTLETNTTYEANRVGLECAKMETVVGQVGEITIELVG